MRETRGRFRRGMPKYGFVFAEYSLQVPGGYAGATRGPGGGYTGATRGCSGSGVPATFPIPGASGAGPPPSSPGCVSGRVGCGQPKLPRASCHFTMCCRANFIGLQGGPRALPGRWLAQGGACLGAVAWGGMHMRPIRRTHAPPWRTHAPHWRTCAPHWRSVGGTWDSHPKQRRPSKRPPEQATAPGPPRDRPGSAPGPPRDRLANTRNSPRSTLGAVGCTCARQWSTRLHRWGACVRQWAACGAHMRPTRRTWAPPWRAHAPPWRTDRKYNYLVPVGLDPKGAPEIPRRGNAWISVDHRRQGN